MVDESSGPGELQKAFWVELLRRSRDRTALFANISPGPQTWMETRSGHRGARYMYLLRNTSVQVVLWIDRGIGSDVANKQLFDQLYAQKEEIERKFGNYLEWEYDPKCSRRAYIRHTITLGGLHMHDHWLEIMDAMIDAMIRLEASLQVPLLTLS